MEKIYLDGRLCNGKGRKITEYTKKDLLEIARNNHIALPKGSTKDDICKLLIAKNIYSEFSLPPPQSFSSIEELMNKLDVKDARELIHMTEGELEEIISRIKLYNGTVTMKDFLQGKTGSERAKAFLISMADKYCRCLKGVESKPKKGNYNPNAICSSSVFNSKGLKGPGSSYQCRPMPLLLAPKGKTYLLEKK